MGKTKDGTREWDGEREKGEISGINTHPSVIVVISGVRALWVILFLLISFTFAKYSSSDTFLSRRKHDLVWASSCGVFPKPCLLPALGCWRDGLFLALRAAPAATLALASRPLRALRAGRLHLAVPDSAPADESPRSPTQAGL